MIVKCPKCAAETDVGADANDLSDTRYKLTCSELHAHLIAKGGQDTAIECPYMHRARDAIILEFRRNQRGD